MVDIAQLGIQVNSQPAVKAVGDLDRLTAAAGKADVAADRLATNTGKVGPAMAGAGQNSRMFAMQLSQVAQQTSATGNFVQALAIQLPDMALGFGAVGIAAGVVAGAVLPLLAGALMSTSGESEALKESLDALSDATEAYSTALQNTQIPSDELIARYGTLSVAARDFAAALLEIEQVNAFEGLSSTIEELTGPLLALRDFNEDLTDNWFRLGRELGITKEQADNLAGSLSLLARAEGPAAQADAAQRLAARLLQAAGSYQNMSAEARAVYDSTVQIGNEAAEIVGTTENAADAATRLERNMADAYGLYAATRNMASDLANETERAAAAAFALAQQQIAASGDVYSGRGGDPRTSNQQGYGEFSYSGPALDQNNNVIPGRNGGGGGGTDQYAADLEALVGSLETERQILEEWYAESEALLMDRRAIEILGTQEHKEAMLELEAEYQRRLLEIDQQSGNSRLALAQGIFGGIADLASAMGAKGEKAARAFGAAEALINVYRAQAQVLGDPKLSFFQKIPAMLAVGAAGMRVVSALRSGGGSAVAGGGSVGAVAAQGQQQAQQQTVEYIVRGIDKDALYTGEMLSRIFDGLTEEAQKRGVQTAVRFI